MIRPRVIKDRYYLSGKKLGKLFLGWDDILNRDVLVELGKDTILAPRVRHLVQLQHPHLLQVLDYYPGAIIFEKAISKPISPAMVTHVLHALQYLHGQGLSHGNISRENILINREGQVKLAGCLLMGSPEQDRLALDAIKDGCSFGGDEYTIPHGRGQKTRGIDKYAAVGLGLFALLVSRADLNYIWFAMLTLLLGLVSIRVGLSLALAMTIWILYATEPVAAGILGLILLFTFPLILKKGYWDTILICLTPVTAQIGLIYVPSWLGARWFGPWRGGLIGVLGCVCTYIIGDNPLVITPEMIIFSLTMGFWSLTMGAIPIFFWSLIVISLMATLTGLYWPGTIDFLQFFLSMVFWLLIHGFLPARTQWKKIGFNLG